MSDPFSIKLRNKIPTDLVSFNLERAEATGLAPDVEVCLMYKAEEKEKWQTLWTFKTGDDQKNFPLPSPFFSRWFQITSNKEESNVTVTLTGSRTSPVVSEELYPKPAASPEAKVVSSPVFDSMTEKK